MSSSEGNMKNLLVRLNTYGSLQAATAEDRAWGQGIYVNFGEESELYKGLSFKNVIGAVIVAALTETEKGVYNSLIKETTEDVVRSLKIGKELANKYEERFKGSYKPLAVHVYSPESEDFVRNVNDGIITGLCLEDKIKDYIVEKEITSNGETYKVDYLDIVVTLNTFVT